MNALSSPLGKHALAIFKAGVAAVEPVQAVRAHFSYDETNSLLIAGEHSIAIDNSSRLFVVGAGKAAGPMAAAVEKILGDRLTEGVIVTKYHHYTHLEKTRLLEAGHPIPDENGLAASHEIVDLLEQAGANDVVICLISGGGSALLPSPAAGISLQEKMALTDLLLACGAPIDEANTVRKHLSELKGGGLAQKAAPARLINLILSDVVGDPLDAIASGPTVPDTTTFADALAILRKYELTEKVPATILAHLHKGAAGEIPETPKPGSAIFDHTFNVLVGNNRMAVDAAVAQAQALGYQTHIISTTLSGETRDVAAEHGAMAREALNTGKPVAPPACLISGGETTVTLTVGHGKGGRNQEFALAAALQIEDLPGVCSLSAGTDGTDGPTDAAGAIVDGTTLQRARKAGLDAGQTLENHDAYPFFKSLDDLVITGPTNTNVMDLNILLIQQDSA